MTVVKLGVAGVVVGADVPDLQLPEVVLALGAVSSTLGAVGATNDVAFGFKFETARFPNRPLIAALIGTSASFTGTPKALTKFCEGRGRTWALPNEVVSGPAVLGSDVRRRC